MLLMDAAISEQCTVSMVSDCGSDVDESDDCFSAELKSDFSNDSDTDILSETELAEFLPSTFYTQSSF
ncbi:hypothetical protein TNCV_1816011 [Trichonephila clavipes]|nr:hypothetical protein TNCV_1816011 [Trichonephila clavipes]